jgi:hypothetical protein
MDSVITLSRYCININWLKYLSNFGIVFRILLLCI